MAKSLNNQTELPTSRRIRSIMNRYPMEPTRLDVCRTYRNILMMFKDPYSQELVKQADRLIAECEKNLNLKPTRA